MINMKITSTLQGDFVDYRNGCNRIVAIINPNNLFNKVKLLRAKALNTEWAKSEVLRAYLDFKAFGGPSNNDEPKSSETQLLMEANNRIKELESIAYSVRSADFCFGSYSSVEVSIDVVEKANNLLARYD
jgi:hypothetical protein